MENIKKRLEQLLQSVVSLPSKAVSGAVEPIQQKLQDWAIKNPQKAEALLTWEPLLNPAQTVRQSLQSQNIRTPQQFANKIIIEVPKEFVDYMGGTLRATPKLVEQTTTTLTKPLIGEKASSSLGKLAGTYVEQIVAFPRGLYEKKPLIQHVGDLLRSVGAVGMPGKTLGAAGLNILLQSGGTLLSEKRLPTTEEITESTQEGIKFGSLFAPLGGLAGTMIKPLSKTITGGKEFGNINSWVRIWKNAPVEAKATVFKEATKRFGKEAFTKALEGGLGFGTYEALSSEGTPQERIKKGLEGATTGAIFGAGTYGLGQGISYTFPRIKSGVLSSYKEGRIPFALSVRPKGGIKAILKAEETKTTVLPAGSPFAPTKIPKGMEVGGYQTTAPELKVKPKTEEKIINAKKILKQIRELEEKIMNAKMEEEARKELIEQQLSNLTSQDLKDLAILRKMVNSREYQEGDIMVLYKKNPKLMGRILDRMREITNDYELGNNKTDEELLEIALNMPKKSDLRTPKMPEIQELKALKEKAKQIHDLVYNSETDPDLKAAIIKNNEKILKENAEREYKEWQNQVFKDAVAQEKARKKELLSKITKAVETNTRSPITKIEELKDISNLAKGARDLYRNFKVVFGNMYDDAKRIILDPFDEAKGKFINELKGIEKNLYENVIKLGINKGSKESALVQLYGEGKISLDELKKQSPNKWKQIVKADQWFREQYDRLLDEVNNIRAKIYPNDPSKIIPRRKDYYRHFREIAQGIQGLKNIFDTPANIESNLSGISEFTKPKTRFLSFAQRRRGEETDYDAVGGFIDYVKAAVYAKNIDPHIKNFRSLANELAVATAPNTPYAGKLNNFIEFLHDFANDLAGKTNPLDRAIQKYIPGGRKTFRALNWLNNRVKANVIIGNLSSALAQLFNIPQGMAEVKNPKYWVRGLGDVMASIFVKNEPMEKSIFLNERYNRFFEKFNRGLLERPKQFLLWLSTVGDEIGTKFIWNMNYRKALDLGIENPIKYADEITRKLVAGRGIGEVPLIYKSKIAQLTMPFQLEVGNFWWVMKDMVDEKAFGKLVTLFITGHLFNKAAESIRGSGVTLDPIQAMIDSIETFEEEENKKIAVLKAGGRLTGEVLSNIPFGQSLASIYPEYGLTIPGTKEKLTRKEFFGRSDPTRFGSGLLVARGITDPLFKVLPPYGGQQIKKTLEGLKAFEQGYSETPSGRIRYPIEQNLRNAIQSALFGQYSIPEAKEYFDKKRQPLSEKQSELVKIVPNKKELYQQMIEESEWNKLINKFKKLIEEGEEITPEEAALILDEQAEKTNAALILDEQAEKTNAALILGEQAEKIKAPLQALVERKKLQAKFNKADQFFDLYLQAPDEKTAQEIEKNISKLGIDFNEGLYNYLSKQDVAVKTDYVKAIIENIEPEKKLEILASLRKEGVATGQKILSNGVIDNLYDEGLISAEEKKYLKNLVWLAKEKKVKVKKEGGGGKKVKIGKPPEARRVQIRKIEMPRVKIKTPEPIKLKPPEVLRGSRTKTRLSSKRTQELVKLIRQAGL